MTPGPGEAWRPGEVPPSLPGYWLFVAESRRCCGVMPSCCGLSTPQLACVHGVAALSRGVAVLRAVCPCRARLPHVLGHVLGYQRLEQRAVQ